MLLVPNDMNNLYLFLKHVVIARGEGYDIQAKKSEIFEHFEMYCDDKRKELYPDMYSDLVHTTIGRNHSLSNKFSETIKVQMSKDLKKFGMAKVGSTSRFDIVVGETRKNTLFICNNLSHLFSILGLINAETSQEIQDSNAEALFFIRSLAEANILNSQAYYETTFSRIGTINRRLTVSRDRDQDRITDINYCPGKYKYAFNGFDLNCLNRFTSFLKNVNLYCSMKERSRELFITNLRGEKTCIFDLLFIPAETVVELYVQRNYTEPRSEAFDITI